MPKAAKYLLIGILAIWVLRNPNVAATSISDVLNAIFLVADETTKPKT
jgi:hypothetical protein